MRRKMRKRGKVMALTLSAVVAVSALLAGTYAWRSVSQKALNEAKGSLNPGARLHDDFNGMNLSSMQTADSGSTDGKVKYVYVENFTEPQKQTMVYARIRLDEYLETGVGAGKSSNDATKSAQSLVTGAIMENKTTWTPYKWDNDQTFRKYVTLSTGGDTVYMPTFNKDQDSLEADINGTLGGLDKNIETDPDDYSDYVKYTYDAAGTNTSKVTDIEIYDAEGDGLDKVKEAGLDVETIVAAVKDSTTGKFNVAPNASSITIDGRSYTVTKMEPDTISTSADITAIYVDLDPSTTGVTPQADIILKTAEHTAQMTLDTDPSLDAASNPGIMSMTDWNALPQSDKIGKYWVYDSEGWLYWAEPIEPSTATGCLLNSIAINDTTPDGKSLQSTEYYYGLNVVAQFATAGDWGEKADKTGFYKEGLTTEGEKLLNTIAAKENPNAAYEVGISLQNAAQTVAPGSSVPLSVKVENLQTGQDEAFDLTQISWSIDWTASQSAEEKGGRSVTVHPTSIDENGVLTIAENETAETLVIVATYNYDTTNVKKTVEGRFTIKVNGELNYLLTIEPSATTEVMKGTSVTFNATAQKQIGNDAATETNDGKITWSVVDAVSGNALNSNTAIDPESGKLTVDLAETATELKVIATYTVEYVDESGDSLGKKQWTAEKKITTKEGTTEQVNVNNTALGDKVRVGDVEYWKIYEGIEKSTGKKVALMWQTELEIDYTRKSFGTSCRWKTSEAKNYLESTYLINHNKIKEMIDQEIIPQVTNYQRTDPADKSSIESSSDTVFLLSEADLLNCTVYKDDNGNVDDIPDEREYTTYGVTGNGTQLLTELSNRTMIMIHHDVYSSQTWAWLRSPRCNTTYVAGIYKTGEVDNLQYNNSGENIMLRPAFWMYL